MNSTEQLQVRHRTVLDDDGRHAARVYAEALYRVAESRSKVEELGEELHALVHELLPRTPELELLLASAALSRDREKEVLDRIFRGKCSDTLVDFLQVLNKHDRLDILRAVAAAYEQLVDRKSGRVMVQVRSAVPLNDDQRGRLSRTVQEVTTREPVLQDSVDPDLLGGMVVQVGDWVYDASVRTKLGTIRSQLIERSSHGIERDRDHSGAH